MANDLILGKLRFDTAALDGQLKTVNNKLNEIKRVAAEAKRAAESVNKGTGKKADTYDTSLIREATTA